MDFIDVDQVLEVPDTPDRLLGSPALRNSNSDRYRIRRESDDSVNCNNNRVANKDYSCERIRSREREIEKPNTGKQRLFIRPDSCSKSRVFSTSKNVGQTIDAVRHDKGKALCISDVNQSTRRAGHSYDGLAEKNMHMHSGVSRGNDYRKGVLRFNGFPMIASGSYELNSTDKVDPVVDRGKDVGFFHTAFHKDEINASMSLKPCTTSKVPQKRMLVRNGCLSPYNVAKLKNAAAERDIVDLVEEKGIDSGAPASESRSNSGTTSKVPQKRMLVRNGCISPYNVAKLKNAAAERDIVDLVEEKGIDSGAPASESRSNSTLKANNIAEKHETGRLVREKRSDSGAVASGSQSSVVDIKDLVAEAKDSRRCKGKGLSHHPSSEEPAAESSRLSHRRLVFKKPADKSSDYSVDTHRCSAETETWRTLHSERKQRDAGQQNIMQIDHRIGRDIEHRDNGAPQVVSPQANNLRINRQREDSASRNSGKHPISCIVGAPQVMSPHANSLRINRQREDSASRNSGKRPISCIVDSAAEHSSSRSKRNKNLSVMGTSNPVSEPNSNSADSSIRSLQIEADEMLARELQEQLYAEELTSAVANAEMDIPLAFARSAHQDDNARGAGERHLYQRRGASISNVRGRVRPSTSGRRSFRRLPQPQPQPHTSTRMAQLRRNFLEHQRSTLSTSNLTNSIFPPNMYAELRLGMLEALGAVADSRMPRDLLQVRREFNEGDYEMLLSLDEDNHQHGGATRAQINNLPESVVQVETSQECVICLEIPSVGETIRHLPCLHRFHKACIDQWLGRKTSCPVCKSSIT